METFNRYDLFQMLVNCLQLLSQLILNKLKYIKNWIQMVQKYPQRK